MSQKCLMLRSHRPPHACGTAAEMEHRFETEVEVGTLGGRYIQPKAKEDKEDLKELMDSHRASTSPQGASQDNGDTVRWSAM